MKITNHNPQQTTEKKGGFFRLTFVFSLVVLAVLAVISLTRKNEKPAERYEQADIWDSVKLDGRLIVFLDPKLDGGYLVSAVAMRGLPPDSILQDYYRSSFITLYVELFDSEEKVTTMDTILAELMFDNGSFMKKLRTQQNLVLVGFKVDLRHLCDELMRHNFVDYAMNLKSRYPGVIHLLGKEL